MKKVLILTYYWPPAGGPGVQRVVRFVRYLPEFGWQPIVLTVKDGDYPARDESLQEKIPPQCRVYRSPIPEPYRLYRKFTGKALDEPLPKSILSEAANSSLKDRLARWIRVNLFIPDARVGWLLTGGKVGRRILKEENPAIIFSTSPPQTVQLLARRLARYSRKPWVADFRDPWVEAYWLEGSPRTFLARWVDGMLERKVLGRADLITTVSEGLGKMFQQKGGARYEIIQNGMEPLSIAPRPTDRFRILYFGNLTQHQNPEPLLEALTRLPEGMRRQIEVVFVGGVFRGFWPLLERYRSRVHIVTRPYMPHKELMAYAAREAGMLFRPIARSAYAESNVGAKTYDYLALRKPILTLGKPNSVSAQILRETRSGEIFEYEDVEGIANFIKQQLAIWEKNHYLWLDNERQLLPYTTRYQVSKLVELFEALNP